MTHAAYRATRRKLLICAGASAAAIATSSFARAQGAVASKPIRIVVTAAPGGLTDLVARQYGEFIGRKLGQPVLVDNRPGGGGTIASAVVAKAPADGQTLLMTPATGVWQSQVLFNQLSYDPVPSSIPALLDQPGNVRRRLAAATWSRTTDSRRERGHSGGALQGRDSDVGRRFRRPGPGGRGELAGAGAVYAAWCDPPNRPFGTACSPLLPDIATLQEQGARGAVFNLNLWLSLRAPANAPEDVLQRLSAAVREAYESPSVREMNRNFGVPGGPTDLSEARRRWVAEAPQWRLATEQSGLKVN